MDKNNSDCYRVLDLFLPLVDKKIDKIFGLTLLPEYIKSDERGKPITKSILPGKAFVQI